MQISYGLWAFYVCMACIGGAVAGAVIVAMFSAAQVKSLQDQLNQKSEVWCKGCDYFKRLTVCNEKLADRESYIKTLEERCATLQRSNRALGVVVQKKSWRVA